MHLGYRTFNAKLMKEEGQVVLFLDDFGKLLPLDYIKQGFRVIQATPSEIETMYAAGYAVKVERR